MARQEPDVLVLGGGVIGLACAHALLKAGRSVTVVEQGTVGCGASHGNCGTLTPSHAPPLAMPGTIRKALRWMFQSDAPLYVKPRLDFELLYWLGRFALRCNWKDFRAISRAKVELLLRSRELIERQVVDEKLACEFEAGGTLYVYRDAKAFEDGRWLPDALKEVGLPVDVMDGAAARRLEPALDARIVGGYLNPRDGHLRPDRFVAELGRRVREMGGEILERRPVIGFTLGGDRVDAVLTAQGELRARDVVLALGAWSPTVARPLELRLPIQPGKGYSITFDRPQVCPRIPLILRERSVCVTAWSSGYRLGSTMEFSGYDASLNRTRLDALVRSAGEYLREPVGPRRVEEWFGWRPMTWDDMPIIDRAPRQRNLVLATGHGMLGVSLSAITGKLVAEIVTGATPSLDLAPCRLDRFH